MTLPNSSSINAYGSGVLVDAVPLVDPTSEMGAAALNPLRNDVSAMTATAARAIFQFVGDATSGIASTATWTAGFDSVWGNSAAVQATVQASTGGKYLITFPASVSDQIGNNILVNIRNAKATIGGASLGTAVVTITSASTFEIQLYDSVNTPTFLPNSLIFVEVF